MQLPICMCAGAADVYPSRPVRLIVPFSAGGATDLVARVFASKLGETLGQSIVVDNRPGAAGMIGTEAAARAAPDGYTLFLYGISQTISPALYKKLPYDHTHAFAGVSTYGTVPNVFVIHPAIAATTVQEFARLARTSNPKMKYAFSGIGASPHLTMELFKARAGVDLLHVPYKIASQGYLDLASGQLQATFTNLPTQLAFIKSGRVRALAVSSAKRVDQLPDVPTMMESGYPDFEVTVWYGISLQRATPTPILGTVHSAMMKALAAPDLKQRFFENGVTPAPMSREAFTAFIDAEMTRWVKVVKDAGATLEFSSRETQ